MTEPLEQRRMLANLGDLVGLAAASVPLPAVEVGVDNPNPAQKAQVEDDFGELVWLANNVNADQLAQLERVDSNLLVLYARSMRDNVIGIQGQTIHGAAVTDGFLHDGFSPMLHLKVDNAAAVEAAMTDLGFEVAGTASSESYDVVDVFVPTDRLMDVLEVDGVRGVVMQSRPTTGSDDRGEGGGPQGPTRIGSVLSEWDNLSGAQQLRRIRTGLDGNIIDFGVMSDSINRVAG
ncbi:MAG: hypothetical protein AAGK78_17455, partial [Planctomycetota bacterium]